MSLIPMRLGMPDRLMVGSDFDTIPFLMMNGDFGRWLSAKETTPPSLP